MNDTHFVYPQEHPQAWSYESSEKWQPAPSYGTYAAYGAPLTPPQTLMFEERRASYTSPTTATFHVPPFAPPRPIQTTTLPSITSFDNFQSSRGIPPLTPPDDADIPSHRAPYQYPTSPSPFPPHSHPQPQPEHITPAPGEPESDAHFLWLDQSHQQQRSAHFIAEKMCEMICYLWFSQQSSLASPQAPTRLQLHPTPQFISFTQKLLETTQVSQSVIVLGLHYVWKLKLTSSGSAASKHTVHPGSEFRIALTSLLLANKILDDNTYTNRTWSEVSSIPLNEINTMEIEFLSGLKWNLYVDKANFQSWMNLLRGLVSARTKAEMKKHSTRHALPHHQHLRNRQPIQRPSMTSHRSRSISPPPRPSIQTSFPTQPHQHTQPPVYLDRIDTDSSPSKAGSKRSAVEAFSPVTASYSSLPAKRPSTLPSLLIPDTTMPSVGVSTDLASPVDALSGFGKMSIESPAKVGALGKSYEYDMGRRSVPENLYFYTLACSPSDPPSPASSTSSFSPSSPPQYLTPPSPTAKEPSLTEREWERKAKLRYHPPPQLANPSVQATYDTAHVHNQIVKPIPTYPYTRRSRPSSYHEALPRPSQHQDWIPPSSPYPASQSTQPDVSQPAGTSSSYYYAHRIPQIQVQSARTSPDAVHTEWRASDTLESYRDRIWNLVPASTSAQFVAPAFGRPHPQSPEAMDQSDEEDEDEMDEDEDEGYVGSPSPSPSPLVASFPANIHLDHPVQSYTASSHPRTTTTHTPRRRRASLAPFANAGPPGIHQVDTQFSFTVPSNIHSSAYASHDYPRPSTMDGHDQGYHRRWQ